MNYGDKHTEDSLVSRLGRCYGIERGLDCGPNILMRRYRDENGWIIYYGTRKDNSLCEEYEADFLYITKGYYLYEVEVKISISDFRADLQKPLYHNFPDVRGFLYCVSSELYKAHSAEIECTCKDRGAGLIVMYSHEFKTLIRPKIRKDVKPLTPMRYLHYLRLFAKKWVRKREEE